MHLPANAFPNLALGCFLLLSSRCPRTSFIHDGVIDVDDTFVVPPPEVNHALTSRSHRFASCQGESYHQRLIVDEVTDAFCFCSALSRLHTTLCLFQSYIQSYSDSDWIRSTESHRPLTVFGVITWLDNGETRGCTLRKIRFLRSNNPTNVPLRIDRDQATRKSSHPSFASLRGSHHYEPQVPPGETQAFRTLECSWERHRTDSVCRLRCIAHRAEHELQLDRTAS